MIAAWISRRISGVIGGVILLLIGPLIGCTDGKESAAPEDTGTLADASVRPVVEGVEALDCTTQQSAGDAWIAMISVSDPQGAYSVGGGTEEILEGEAAVASYALACNDGLCTGSFLSSYDGIGCDRMGEIRIRFTVEDDDGHRSAPLISDT